MTSPGSGATFVPFVGTTGEATVHTVLGAALDIFSRGGYAYLSRWAHVFAGITWIGLLYYFNFVQVPAFGEMEAAARNNTIDKLASRALWWFRWAAALTLASGLLLLIFQKQYKGDFMRTAPGVSIYAGILLAVTMFLNVWLVIWPNQIKVIANARNVQAGGEADPAAAPAGRKALLASRQNTIFSLPMLIFMVGTSHFPFSAVNTSGGKRATFWIIWIVLWGLFEANALGYLGGTGAGGPRAIYDTHKNTIIAGFAYSVVALFLFSLVLTS